MQRGWLITLIIVMAVAASTLITYLVVRPTSPGLSANLTDTLSGFSEDQPLDSTYSTANDAARLERLSTSSVLGPALSPDGRKVVYLERTSGQLMASDFSGKTNTPYQTTVLTGSDTLIWERDATTLLARQAYQGKLRWLYHRLDGTAAILLAENISSPVFSPTGNKLAYLYFDPASQTGNISLANPDGSNFSPLIPTRQDSLIIDWLDSDHLLFSKKVASEGIFILDTASPKLNRLIEENNTSSWLVSPDSNNILYQQQPALGGGLVVFTMTTKTKQVIGLNSQPEQCAWGINSDKLFCAGSLTDGVAALFVIDLKNKQIRQLSGSLEQAGISIYKPFLTPTADYLIFINQLDNYLYSYRL